MRDVYKQIESYSKFNPSPLSIKKFIDFGESLMSDLFSRSRLLFPGTLFMKFIFP